jgi:hypothetical protein
MTDYLKLIVFPSRTLDQFRGKKPEFLTLYILVTIAMAGLVLPKYIASSLNSPKGLEKLTIYLAFMPFIYFPFVYGAGYLYWIVAKAFKGISSFIEMRSLIGYSTLPFIIQFFFSIPFVVTGLIKNDPGIITHDNFLAHLILWLLSFRITMVGIAKYNKFNWTITLTIYFIVGSIVGGLALLLSSLR